MLWWLLCTGSRMVHAIAEAIVKGDDNREERINEAVKK